MVITLTRAPIVAGQPPRHPRPRLYPTGMNLRHEVALSEWGGGKAALRRVSERLFPSLTRVAGNCGV